LRYGRSVKSQGAQLGSYIVPQHGEPVKQDSPLSGLAMFFTGHAVSVGADGHVPCRLFSPVSSMVCFRSGERSWMRSDPSHGRGDALQR